MGIDDPSITIIRQTHSRCPVCAKRVDATVILVDGKAYLHRECPEHGPYRYLLSEHGEAYADLDTFYYRLNGVRTQGRATNMWIVAESRCQQNCVYCSAEVQRHYYERMSWDEIVHVLDEYPDRKFSLSGGEPTLHPNVFDFFGEVKRRGLSAQLATNGLLLASKEYCQKLKDAGVEDVRFSIESLDKDEADVLGLGERVETKLKALANLEELGIAVNLSPTLFKGVNDEQLYHLLEYAKDRPNIRQIAAAGFAWVGSGASLPAEMMIAPDEMMDIVYRHYGRCEREEVFQFQKLILALTHVLGFRYCNNTQAMVFVRDPRKGLDLLVHFLNVKRLGKYLDWWVRVKPKSRWASGILLAPLLATGMRLKTVPLIVRLFKLLWANIAQIDIHQYPAGLLTLTLNTNCTVLNADDAVAAQCTSDAVSKTNGELHCTNASYEFLHREECNRESGVWEQLRRSKPLEKAHVSHESPASPESEA